MHYLRSKYRALFRISLSTVWRVHKNHVKCTCVKMEFGSMKKLFYHYAKMWPNINSKLIAVNLNPYKARASYTI